MVHVYSLKLKTAITLFTYSWNREPFIKFVKVCKNVQNFPSYDKPGGGGDLTRTTICSKRPISLQETLTSWKAQKRSVVVTKPYIRSRSYVVRADLSLVWTRTTHSVVICTPTTQRPRSAVMVMTKIRFTWITWMFDVICMTLWVVG